MVIQAAAQDLTQTPTTASLLLLNMLASRINTVDVFLPGALHMITKSELYSMCIHYAAQELPEELSQDLVAASPQSLTRA